MKIADTNDPRIEFLKNMHGLNHDQAARVLEKLQAHLALDIVNGDTGESLVDLDDDLSDLVDWYEDTPLSGDRRSIPAD